MKKIKTALESIIKKDKNYSNLTNFLGMLLFFIYFMSVIPVLLIAVNYFGDGFMGLTMTIVGLNTIIIGSSFLLYQICILPFMIILNLYKRGEFISNLLQKESKRVGNIDGILIQTQELFKNLRKIIFIRKVFGLLLTRQSNKALDIYFESIQLEAYNLLTNLRSDLTLRLTEHRSTLEEAKSEVSTHIHGTDELNQVSELQRQRLDQQIAQFEELQRVLVRV